MRLLAFGSASLLLLLSFHPAHGEPTSTQFVVAPADLDGGNGSLVLRIQTGPVQWVELSACMWAHPGATEFGLLVQEYFVLGGPLGPTLDPVVEFSSYTNGAYASGWRVDAETGVTENLTMEGATGLAWKGACGGSGTFFPPSPGSPGRSLDLVLVVAGINATRGAVSITVPTGDAQITWSETGDVPEFLVWDDLAGPKARSTNTPSGPFLAADAVAGGRAVVETQRGMYGSFAYRAGDDLTKVYALSSEVGTATGAVVLSPQGPITDLALDGHKPLHFAGQAGAYEFVLGPGVSQSCCVQDDVVAAFADLPIPPGVSARLGA